MTIYQDLVFKNYSISITLDNNEELFVLGFYSDDFDYDKNSINLISEFNNDDNRDKMRKWLSEFEKERVVPYKSKLNYINLSGDIISIILKYIELCIHKYQIDTYIESKYS